MFKRKLFKRALPFILSVAMMFESLPATAMATESSGAEQMTETEALDEEGGEAGSEKESGSEEKSEPVSASEAEAESGSEPKSEEKSELESKTAETVESSNADASESSTTENTTEEESGSESEPGSESKPEDEEETVGIEEKEADAENSVLDTKLEIEQAAYENINQIKDSAGVVFQRDLSKDEPTYTTQYSDPSRCGELQDAIKGKVKVVVNDQTIKEEDLDPSMSLRFSYDWKGKKADTSGTDDPYTNNVDGFPKDAGEYRLRITVEAVDTLCKEAYIDVYVTINPAELTLDLDEKECLNINPGKTVADLQKQITEEYVLEYKDGSKTIDDKTKVVAENGVKVEIKKSGEEAALAPETKLDTDAEYIAVISFTLLDAVKNNYTVGTENFYIVKVGDLVETKIDVKVDNELPIIETYDTEPVVLADVVKLTKDYPKVMIKGKDSEEFDEELKLAEGETVEAGWYRREQVAVEAPDTDEITDTTVRYSKNNDKQRGYRYVKLDVENPTDAGDYYVIWKYAGDEGKAYKKSVSEPLAVTIKPAPVVITVTDSAETLQNLFRERMSQEELNRAYAQINYNVSKVGADGKVDAASNVKDSESFFGTTYGADAEGGNRCYIPVFELQRGIKSKIVDGKPTDVTDDKEKDWHKVTDKDLIKSDDMYVYEYRLIITGEKAVYNTAGDIDDDKTVPITELSTDSANRNYLVATDSKTLAENAAKVELQNAKDATIDTSAIVEAFTGKGLLEEPAVKIYDEKPLFERRGDYKKATVTGADNTALSSEDLTYTWRKVDLKTYEDYMKESATEKEKQPLNDRKIWSNIETGGTNETDGTLIDTIDSDFYELKVEYKDPTGAYYAKPATVYFKVEKQEIVIVAGDQIAQNGRNKDDWRDKGGLDKTLYKIYRVPDNDFAKYDGTSELVLEESRDKKEFINPDIRELYIDFVVQNQEKNSDGSNNKDKYVDTAHDVFDKDAYVYGVVGRFDGRNYTTIDKDVKDEVKHNEVVSPINFTGEGTLYAKFDKAAIEKMTKMYDGEPIVLPTEGFIKLYSDEAMTDANDVTANMLNSYGEYDPAKVSLYWQKVTLDANGNIILDEDGNIIGNKYTTPNAVWGGSYVPVLRFKGDENYKPIDVMDINNEQTGERYGEWKAYSESDYIVTIKPIDITITPQLKETNITAGDTVDSLRLNADLTVVRADGSSIPEKDQIFFNYAELASGVFDEFYKSGVLEEKDNTLYAISKLGGYPAFCTGTSEKPSYWYQINDNGKLTKIEKADSECLRYGRTYTVRLKGDLAEPLKSSYNVTYGAVERKVEERGLSNVRAVSEDDLKQKNTDRTEKLKSIPLKYEYSNGTYTIKPREAIPYYYEKVKVGDVSAEGNYIAYNVYAPKEFSSSLDGGFDENKKKFILGESVKAAGGEILGATPADPTDSEEVGQWNVEWTKDQQYGEYITVLFPVTEDAKERAFTITWEEGYTETFKLADDVELETDLKQAVAPKSLKFNGVQTKMAVGDTQQLDVKITKKQLGDVIKLQYRIAGTQNETSNQFISINPDTGVVTARHTQKKATTQVEAYPVYRDKDGKLVEIKGKGVKTAKTKITVTDLAAPSVKKIVTTDTKADVYYTVPANGYRREIYVIEAKKAKADVFESNIANVKNGRYTEAGFVVEPTFVYPATETANYDSKTKQTKVTISGLTAGKNYVVYVRNVSQARTLDDGTSVDLAFKGGVKNFLATKSQLTRLIPYFNVNSSNMPDKKNPVTHPVYTADDGTEKIDDTKYEIDLLFAKSAQLALKGWFIEKESYGDAEDKDRREYDLPLTKPLQATYLNPKLTYGVFDTDDYYNPWNSGVEVSKYAAISNKGKLTIKGTDWNGAKTVYIYAKSDNEVIGSVALTIKSDVDSVVGKKAKLKVGDDKPLSDFLEYKQGKKKVPNYRSSKIMITDEMIQAAADAGYKIYDNLDEIEDRYEGNGDWVSRWDNDDPKQKWNHNWYITAVSPNKSPFRLNITDQKSNGEPMTATVTLTSAPIEAVKNLKVSYVDDKNITISFKHAGKPQGFEVEVVDTRNSVIQKKFVPNNVVKGMNTYVSATAPAYVQSREKWNLKNMYGDNLVYFEKTKNYAYTISNDKLLRLSSYTVKVTPVYENQRPKTVSKKVKMTNIPAARDINMDVLGFNVNGGVWVGYYSYSYLDENNMPKAWDDPETIALYAHPFFTAGNTYTLQVSDRDAKARVTDTLTWKSSNTKVATIKSRPGTYTATMKALKSGITTITVTSKITKKVIGRYEVMVKATGNADGFGGDYEQAKDDKFYKDVLAVWDPFYEGRLEVLSVENPIIVNASSVASENYERTWVTFTAPAFGEYSIVKEGGDGRVEFFYANGDKISSEDYGISADDLTETVSEARLVLEQGQKIYMRVTGSFTLRVTESTSYKMLSATNNAENALEVKANEWVTFTAPEDNYYSFGPANVIDTFRFNNAPVDMSTIQAGETVTVDKVNVSTKAYSLKAGETLFIKTAAKGKLFVEYRKLSKPEMELDLKARPTVKPELKLDNLTEYVKFTAPTTNRYDFVTKVTKNVEVTVYDADGNTDYFGQDTNIVPKNAVAQLNAESDEAEKPEEKTTTLYMQAGQTIIFKFTVIGGKDGFKDDKLDENGKETFNKKAEAEVTVSAPEIKSIEPNKDDTIGKEKVATYTFTIPKDAKNVTYTVKVEGAGAEKKYLDSKGKALKDITEISVNKDSEVSGILYDKTEEAKTFKTGDTIYVVVKASKDAEAKFSVTSAAPKAIAADQTDSIKVKNGSGSFWYTFTATADGVYEFGVDRKMNETAPSHDYSIVVGDEEVSESTVQELKVGQIKRFRINVTDVVEPDPEKVTTTDMTVFVKTRKAEPAVGENTVSLAKKEIKYYSFTAMTNDTYTVKWEPTIDPNAAQNADIEVNYSDNGLAGSYKPLNGAKTLLLKAGNIVYIEAKENDVAAGSGKLTITAKNASSESLKSGTASSYKLKAGEEKAFKFTAPTAQTTDAEEYSITVTIPKYDANAENPVNVVPTVTVVDAGGKETTPTSVATSNTEGLYVMEVALKKSETVIMTLSVDTDAEGTILVQPRTPSEPKTITNTGDDKVSASKNAYYKFTAPKYGRYHFEVVPAENNDAEISAVKKNSSKINYKDSDFVVLNEGDDLYITVSTSAVTDQTAPLKVAEVAPETISAVDTEFEVTVPANSYKFYRFEAPAHALYTFDTTEITAGAPSVSLYNMKTNKSLSNNTLDQKDEVLVVMKASSVETKFKYKVSKKDIKMLAADGTEQSVDLKAGERAVFEFPVQNADMYVFQITGKVTHSDLVPAGRVVDAKAINRHNGTTENGYYIVNEYEKTARSQTFTVTATEDTKASVKVTKAVVETLTADAAEKTIEINEGECRFVKFIPTARGRYTLTMGDNVLVRNIFNDILELNDRLLIADDKTFEWCKLEVTGSPESKKATAKVKVTTVKPEKISATKAFQVPATGAVWFEFTAPNNAKYEFVVNDKDNKVFVASVEKYAIIDDDNAVSRSVMAKGDKVIIKVPSGAATKDTDLTLDVKETKPVSDKTFWDVKFNGALYPASFEAEKDETYIVTIARKGDENTTYSVEASVADEESENGRKTLGTTSLGNESEITIAPQKEKTTVNLEIKVTGEQSDNSNVLVIVEKVEKKTEDKPQQPDEGTTTPDDNTPKPEA